jgi:hypothetical protein
VSETLAADNALILAEVDAAARFSNVGMLERCQLKRPHETGERRLVYCRGVARYC